MIKKTTRKITVKNIQNKVAVDGGLIKKAVSLVLDEEGMKGEITVVFSDDDYIGELNERFLSIKGPTDVLAFPMDSDGIIGDVVVSAERAAEQSAEYGHSLDRELVLLAVHGALHLKGYDDLEPGRKLVMEKRQDEILRKVFE